MRVLVLLYMFCNSQTERCKISKRYKIPLPKLCTLPNYSLPKFGHCQSFVQLLKLAINFLSPSTVMEPEKKKKKSNKGGEIVRLEPQGLQLLDSDPTFRETFQRVGCLTFCERLQGHHMEVAKEFSLNFDGVKTKIGPLEFQVSEDTIATTTGIPVQGEKWFKGMALDSTYCNDYFKLEHQNEKLSAGVPRKYMLDHFDKLLHVIQCFFTCEGRFNMVYQYHLRLLMHFTGKQALNLPFYLYRSLGKMSNKVQERSKWVEHNIFHSGLIKLLVLEELRKKNGDWVTFLSSTGFSADINSTPQEKRKTPSSSEKIAQTNQKGKGKRAKNHSKIKSKREKGKRVHSSSIRDEESLDQ
jgi:hypothetical protein